MIEILFIHLSKDNTYLYIYRKEEIKAFATDKVTSTGEGIILAIVYMI